MTTTYDPKDPAYLDEADVRGELTRVFDVCQGCRRCVDLCTTFPTLFELLERHDDRAAGRLTPAAQDRIAGECVHCALCSLGCPYADGHEWQVDFPQLMVRAAAMRFRNGHVPARERQAAAVIGRTDVVGRAASVGAPVANRLLAAAAGSLVRRIVAAVTGVSAMRRLPRFARRRFSVWFRERPQISLGRARGRVTVYPTCIVEYQQPSIGKDLVKVYERNGIECSISDGRCCGAPVLYAGDIERFAAVARRNVATLAAEIRRGTELVVAQPTCRHVIGREYVRHVGGADADLVAAHTHDPAEYLVGLHRVGTTALDVRFAGAVGERITYHAACHVRASREGLPSRDLLKLTGARVRVVQDGAGVEDPFGFRAGNDQRAGVLGARLGSLVAAAGGDVLAGDCHLTNTAIAEHTGREPLHPLQVLARAYGIPEEP